MTLWPFIFITNATHKNLFRYFHFTFIRLWCRNICILTFIIITTYLLPSDSLTSERSLLCTSNNNNNKFTTVAKFVLLVRRNLCFLVEVRLGKIEGKTVRIKERWNGNNKITWQRLIVTSIDERTNGYNKRGHFAMIEWLILIVMASVYLRL